MKRTTIISLILGASAGLYAQVPADSSLTSNGIVADTTANAMPSSSVPWIEDEQKGFPELYLEKYDGFLLQKNNRVFIPHDSKYDYERVGQNYVYRKVKESDFWTIVNRPEQAHFVLRYVTVTKGRDHSALLIEPVDYYKKHIDDENLIDFNPIVYQVGSQFSSEDVKKKVKVIEDFPPQ